MLTAVTYCTPHTLNSLIRHRPADAAAHTNLPRQNQKVCGPYGEDQRSRTQLNGLVAHGGRRPLTVRGYDTRGVHGSSDRRESLEFRTVLLRGHSLCEAEVSLGNRC